MAVCEKKTGGKGGGAFMPRSLIFFWGGGRGEGLMGTEQKKPVSPFSSFLFPIQGGNGKPIGREVIWEGEGVVGWLRQLLAGRGILFTNMFFKEYPCPVIYVFVFHIVFIIGTKRLLVEIQSARGQGAREERIVFSFVLSLSTL